MLLHFKQFYLLQNLTITILDEETETPWAEGFSQNFTFVNRKNLASNLAL